MKTRSHLLLAVIASVSTAFSYGSLTNHFFPLSNPSIRIRIHQKHDKNNTIRWPAL